MPAALAVPLWASGEWVRVATNVWMDVALTAAQNIIAGYAGSPALGNVVFFGLGADGSTQGRLLRHRQEYAARFETLQAAGELHQRGGVGGRTRPRPGD